MRVQPSLDAGRSSVDSDEGDGWGEQPRPKAAAAAGCPVRHVGQPAALKGSAATPPSRAKPPVASKPRLGAQKLGAQKLTSKGGGDFDWADMLNE